MSSQKSNKHSGQWAALWTCLAVLFTAGVVASACGAWEGPCGDDTYLENGHFTGTYRSSNMDVSGDEPLGDGARTLIIDRSAGKAIVSFEKDGQVIRQVWTFDPQEIGRFYY